MPFRRFLRQADDDLLDLVELVHPEDAAGLLAVTAGLGAEAWGERGQFCRQFLLGQGLVAMEADQRLFRGADQAEIFVLKLVDLILEEWQVAGTEQRVLLGQARAHVEGEAALDQLALRPEEHRLRQQGSLAAPVVITLLGHLGAARGVDRAGHFADRLVIARGEGEFALGPDLAQFEIVGIALAIRDFGRQEVRQPGHQRLDFRLGGIQPLLRFAQINLQLLDFLPRFRAGLALFGELIAQRPHLLDLVHQFEMLAILGDDGIDVDGGAAAAGDRGFDELGILTQDFDVDHKREFPWLMEAFADEDFRFQISDYRF